MECEEEKKFGYVSEVFRPNTIGGVTEQTVIVNSKFHALRLITVIIYIAQKERRSFYVQYAINCISGKFFSPIITLATTNSTAPVEAPISFKAVSFLTSSERIGFGLALYLVSRHLGSSNQANHPDF